MTLVYSGVSKDQTFTAENVERAEIFLSPCFLGALSVLGGE
jgi:hypothetical protein